MGALNRRHLLGAGAAGALTLAGCGGGSGTTAATTATTGAPVPAGLPGAPDDGAVLAFMLGLEHLQADMYTRMQPAVRGTELDLVKQLAGQEGEHIGKLTDELRRLRHPEPKPRTFKAVPGDRDR